MRQDAVKPHILIVDDNSMMRETVRGILRSKFPKLCVDEAGNGTKAFDLLHHHLPDLILMDIGLPGDNGLKLTLKKSALKDAVRY